MNVFLVIREEKRFPNRFLAWLLGKWGLAYHYQSSVLAAHSTYLEAHCMVSGYSAYQMLKEGATKLRFTQYPHNATVKPEQHAREDGTYEEVLVPEVLSCLLLETELLGKDGKSRTTYKIKQEWVIVPAYQCNHDFKNFTACIHCSERPK